MGCADDDIGFSALFMVGPSHFCDPNCDSLPPQLLNCSSFPPHGSFVTRRNPTPSPSPSLALFLSSSSSYVWKKREPAALQAERDRVVEALPPSTAQVTSLSGSRWRKEEEKMRSSESCYHRQRGRILHGAVVDTLHTQYLA